MQARLQHLRLERFEREEQERILSPRSLRLQTVNGLCGFTRLCVMCSLVALWVCKTDYRGHTRRHDDGARATRFRWHAAQLAVFGTGLQRAPARTQHFCTLLEPAKWGRGEYVW